MDFEALHGIGGSSASSIDNLVESYIVSADGNLNAGDLCEFINGQVRKTFLTKAVSTETLVTAVANALQCTLILDSTRVLLVYTNVSNYYMWAIVLTITGGVITIGTPYQINSINGGDVSTTMLDASHVLMSYYGTNGYLWGVVLTISGNAITKGTLTQINSVSSLYTCSVALDANRVFVYYSGASSYLYGVVLTITDSSIAIGTITTLVSAVSSALCLLKVDSTRVFIYYKNGATTGCDSAIVLISGNAIISTTVKAITGVNSVPTTSIALIDDHHIIVGYRDNAFSRLSLLVLTITATTVYVGLPTQIMSIVIGNPAIALIDSTHVIATYSDTNLDKCIWAVVVTLNENVITVGSFYQVNAVSYSDYPKCVKLNPNTVLITWQEVTSKYIKSKALDITGDAISANVVVNALKPNVIAKSASAVGSASSFLIKGIAKNLVGLLPGTTYYCDNNGNLTTTTTSIKIGVALSTTELLIKKAFWERGL